MIKVILFDIDGTLIDSAEANWRSINIVIKKYGGKELKFEEYKKDFYAHPMRSVLKLRCPKLTESGLDEACTYGVSISAQFYKIIKVNKNVKEVLERLHESFRLGILTGRLGIDVLEYIGIKKLFDHIVTKKDYKNPKPHPEGLLLALEKFGVKPEEIVFVGDQWNDAECGKACGVKTIIFGDAAKGDWNITDFVEILRIIESLNSTNF